MTAQTPVIFVILNMLRTRVALVSFLVNYLDLSGSWAFSRFLHAFRVFSWFLDEGKWFIHDWCVVHMGGQRAGGARCWTPDSSRCGALWPVKCRRRWCRSLGRFTTASAQCPLSSERLNYQIMSHHFDRICIQNHTFKVNYHWKYESTTNLSSNVRPLSWLRLRLIGYTVGTRARSFVMCLYLSSLLRWGWPGKQNKNAELEWEALQRIQSNQMCFDFGSVV